jgi:hypothetical protein
LVFGDWVINLWKFWLLGVTGLTGHCMSSQFELAWNTLAGDK